VLDRIPGRPASATGCARSPQRQPHHALRSVSGPLFYFKLENGSDDKKLYYPRRRAGARLLVDPTILGNPGSTTHSTGSSSWDGKYVAYGISPGGSEDSTIHLIGERDRQAPA